MANTVIRIHNLSKEYKLGVLSHRTLYREVQSSISRLLGKEDPNQLIGTDQLKKSSSEKFLALNDVSLEIKQGDVVGIIGKNGAGKSTLLKILSRVTSPTSGDIKIKGRIASLLEVGTGFHPELTGRENVFLNGAILGMRKMEVQSKFDEIVDFAGIEGFIDTPVKRYSSGMYVRLAFAVAAHLESETLIVDEVLAVGDMDFQRKCIGKMNLISKTDGRTVLFVSHNMSAISSMCTRGIFLNLGKVNYSGSIEECIKRYTNSAKQFESRITFSEDNAVDRNFAWLREVYLTKRNGEYSNFFDYSNEIIVGLVFDMLEDFSKNEFKPYPQINILNSKQETIFASTPRSENLQHVGTGRYKAECVIPSNFLNVDTYFVSIGMAHIEKGTNVAFFKENVLSFEVTEDVLQTGVRIRNGYTGPIPGTIRPLLSWSVEQL